jgi:hypothetical protein
MLWRKDEETTTLFLESWIQQRRLKACMAATWTPGQARRIWASKPSLLLYQTMARELNAPPKTHAGMRRVVCAILQPSDHRPHLPFLSSLECPVTCGQHGFAT